MPDQTNTIKASSPGKTVAPEQPLMKKPSKIFTDYYGSLFLLLIALYVGAGFLVIKPKIDENKQMDAKTRGVRQEIENDKTYFDGLSRSVAAAQGIGTDVLDKVDQAMPRTPSIPDMLVQLSAAAQSSGVTLSNVVFDSASKAPAVGTAVQSMNATLTVTAKDYATFKNFLRTLETSLRLFDVQTISVSGFASDKITFNLQLKAYYYPSAPAK